MTTKQKVFADGDGFADCVMADAEFIAETSNHGDGVRVRIRRIANASSLGVDGAFNIGTVYVSPTAVVRILRAALGEGLVSRAQVRRLAEGLTE